MGLGEIEDGNVVVGENRISYVRLDRGWNFSGDKCCLQIWYRQLKEGMSWLDSVDDIWQFVTGTVKKKLEVKVVTNNA